MIQKLKQKIRNIFDARKIMSSAVFGLNRKIFSFAKGHKGILKGVKGIFVKRFKGVKTEAKKILKKIKNIKWVDVVKKIRGIRAENIFQKIKGLKIKNIKDIFAKPFNRRVGAAVVLVLFLAATFFQNTPQTQGAQFTFFQTDWSGGVTANSAVHPTNENDWNEYSAGTNVVTTTAGQATLSETTHTNFSETFTATTNKDVAATTANWNTSSGQVEMATETSGVNLYEKLNGLLVGSTINAQVKAGDDYYVVATTGKFLKYSSATDTATNLTSKVPGYWSASAIYSLAFDSVNNVVYFGALSGRLARYNTTSYTAGGTYPTADTGYDLTPKISSFISNASIRSLVLDSANNVLYLAGDSGKFARYNTTSYTAGGTYPTADTAYDLTAKISSFWSTNQISKLVLDSSSSLVYILGANNFAKYDIGSDTATDMKGKIASIVGTTTNITANVYANGKIYGGTSVGGFFVYDITSGISTSLTSKITSFWSTNQINSLVLDSTNEVVYLGGASGKFARYNTTAYTGGGTYPTADTAYDLTAKVATLTSGFEILSLALDGANNTCYIGVSFGKFGRYNTTSYVAGGTYPTADTGYSLTAKISGFFGSNSVSSLAIDSANNVLYIGGYYGMLTRYNTTFNDGLDATYPTADTAYNLNSKISSFIGTGFVYSVAFDVANKVLYLGCQSGKLLRYNTTNYAGGGTYPTADTAYNLTTKISSFWSSNSIFSLAFDSANNAIYLGGGSGKFALYNTTSYVAGGTYPTADTGYDLTAKVSSFWSTSIAYSLAFDSVNNVLYLGGASGKFGKYTAGTDTGTNLVSSLNDINFFPPNVTLNEALLDSASKVIYIGGTSGYFLRYNTASYVGGGTYPTADTFYNLTSKISSFFSTSAVYSLTFDSTNNVIYFGGGSGRFGRYNTTGYAGGGIYPTADTAYDLTSKISSFWSTDNVLSLVFDSANNVIYLGGLSSKFARYNTTSYVAGGTYPTADTAYDLTSKVNGVSWNGNVVQSMVVGSGNDLYLGGVSGKFVKYDTGTGVATNLTSKISSFWSTITINNLVFDSVNRVVYLGGSSGFFARYNTASYVGGGTYPTADTGYNLTTKISSFSGSQNISSIALDSVNNVIYLALAGGILARYNTTNYVGGGTYPTSDTAYNLTAKISSFWSTNMIYSLAFDSANNTLYLGGVSGKFARYNTTSNNGLDATYPTADTAYDLVAKISGAPVSWSTTTIYSVTFDSANNVVYIGGELGKFARYNTTVYAAGGTYPTADTAYSLTTKISSFWSSSAVNSVFFDGINNSVYLGGASGKFARYSIAVDSAVNLRSPDTLSFWSTTQINTLAMDSAGKLYIGGASGYFAEKAAAASVSYAQSTTLDAVGWNIAYATLTKNDTIGTGSLVYQLSNNGGSTWETFTPTVNKTFTSVGSDLRFKIAVTGNATVQDMAITYWAYNGSGELTSSKYNTTDSANVLAKMAWSETLPANTDLKFQLKTASSAVGLDSAPWCGPDNGVDGTCNSGTYFTAPTGTETPDDINRDNASLDNQWFQYKAFFTTTDGISTPTLSDATVTYVVNAPPEVQNVTASVDSNGLVTVNYDVRDPDTSSGVTQYDVNVGLQYCTANCSSAGSETWADAATLSGTYGAGVTVAEVDWNSYQMVWTPVTDYNNQFNATNFKVRIKADDGELANKYGYAESAHFDLDTNKPTLNATTVLINDSSSAVQLESSAATLKLQNITGDTVSETVYAQFSIDGSTWYGANSDNTLAAAGNWGTGFALDTLATLSWSWTMTARSESIQVRVKDSYNNIQGTTDSNDVAYNATPDVQTVSALQNSTGTVDVSYEIKDTDTAIGITPNALNVTLQYCTANCSGAGTWTTANTMTGSFGTGVATTSAFVTKNIVWNAKTDYADQYIGSDFKVRVNVDDGETFNNTDSANSGSFILDTKNPTNNSFTIDHTTNQLTLTTPSDDSSYQMSVSNTAGVFSTFEAFTSPYTYGSMTNDPATVYVRIKDAYGNYLDASATTPAKPNNPIYFDISSAAQGTYQEFIAWDVVSAAQVGSGFSSYKVYRKIDAGSFLLLDTITDRTLNYYLDRIKDTNDATEDSDPTFDPANPSTYYYKVVTTDTNGNISAYSGITEDVPNGTGGSDSTPPTITNVQVSNIDTTSAVITWETDELANSSVGYSTDYTYVPERALASFETTNHSITLTGLESDTTYNIRVISEDIYNNEAAVCYGGVGCSNGSNPTGVFTFVTDPGPEISSVAVSSNNTQATISWVTTTNSDSYVVYSDTVTNGALVSPEEVGTPTLVGGNSIFNHSQLISTYNDLALVSGETYYFYVKSTDATAQTAIDNNGGSFYSFTTTQDDDAPVMTGINAAIINNTKAAINWTTDEAATGIVNYGTAPSGPYPSVGEVLTFDKSHYVILSPLTANTVYYYTVTSADINTNEDTSIEYSFTTLNDPAFQHDPISAITGISDPPTVLTDTKAVISFLTDQAAECVIEYGTTTGNYNEVPVSESGYNETHAMHIPGLIFETAYFYQITCSDNLENTVSSTEHTFTTTERMYTESGIGALGDSTAPTISGLGVKVTSGESVTVTWTTDELASSYVRFGIVSGTYTDMAGDPLVNYDQTLYDTAHTVIINGLTPGIKYFFTALSTDDAGNIAESSESSFTTGTSSSLSSINITSASLGEALVTWTTSEKTSSLVEYGTTNLYGQKKEDTATATAHSVTINGLTAATLYHLRVGGKDVAGQRYSSGDYTFTPKSPPQIGVVSITDITEHGVTIAFGTDFPTDFNVTYTSTSDVNDSGSKGKPDFSVSHALTLDALKPGTTYSLKIRATDEQGNSVEKLASNFTTGKDENAPEIKQTRTESALAQNDKVQTIISWETNELSICSLLYREGATGEEKEYKLSDRATLSHVAVVTSFKSGTVYYFKIKSTDEAGNIATSNEYALLTPQKKENIVQIIVNNFQDIFSWTSKIGG